MGSQKKRPVKLTAQDREELVRVTTTGVRGASMIMRARVLLALDISVGEAFQGGDRGPARRLR